MEATGGTVSERVNNSVKCAGGYGNQIMAENIIHIYNDEKETIYVEKKSILEYT